MRQGRAAFRWRTGRSAPDLLTKMSAGSGSVARWDSGLGDPFLRRVPVLACGLGLLFAVLALVMYTRWWFA